VLIFEKIEAEVTVPENSGSGTELYDIFPLRVTGKGDYSWIHFFGTVFTLQ